jgi:hypothetical protein
MSARARSVFDYLTKKMTNRLIHVQPVHEDVASAIIESIPDSVVRSLVGCAFGEARGRFGRSFTLYGEEIPLRLPAESVDMVFYVRIMWAFFSRPDFIRRLLAGEAVPPIPIVRTPMALNDEGAERVRLSISDPICRNLVTAALNEARKQFVKDEAASEAELPAPPCLPFDMEFFATVMEDYFEVPLLIERLLDGQSPAQASGLD